jgi:hypothetical protein
MVGGEFRLASGWKIAVDGLRLPPMNHVLRNLRYVCWLLLLVAQAPVACADEPPAKFKAALIWIRGWPGLMVSESEEDVLGNRMSRVSKARLLPQVKLPSGILRAPVFDVSSEMKKQGLKMPHGSHALYSPSAELFYIESIPDEVGLAETFFWGAGYANTLVSVDMTIVLVSAGKTETLLEVKSMPFVWGQRMGFSTRGEGYANLFVDATLGPDDDTIDLNVLTDIQMRGQSLKKEFRKTISRSKPEDIEIGSLGDAVVTARMVTHRDTDHFGPALFETEARQAAAIAEIQKALQSAPTQ